MKKVALALFGVTLLACTSWRGPQMEAEEFPLKTGAVHIYKLDGFSDGDSMVVTTIGTRRHDDRTIYVDSVAYFNGDSLSRTTEEYHYLSNHGYYYYGDKSVGYLDDPVPMIKFSLYENRMWYLDPEDTLGAYYECTDYDTLWLEPGRYRAFCVQHNDDAVSGVVRYWYAPDVGLVKYGRSVPYGDSYAKEILDYLPGGIPDDTTGD
ncbi:hypothetical protein GF359_01090 [candidate division WOR-3 bacterium]|uniref:DUF4178 domain-containing protein n=1 Tax=candidate division WOR-3 bacterium TaxID=2052148 RepID=A0A9D5K812_UNCW3|nr:hypothetical protein [candidate division WOR-3 bacterium]MBD3363789.1 hypothetical protein [candidate division WOR-3 bacterium]